MPTLPWTSPATASTTAAASTEGTPAPGGAPVVMGTRLMLTSRRHTFRMLRISIKVRRAALASPGMLGISLVAEPWRRTYWTLSAWADEAALRAFVASPVHREAMTSFRSVMADTAFASWTADPGAFPPAWDDARARLS